MTAYDEALATLYQAPLASFVSERKRLAKDLKASGDAAGARKLSQRSRPNISAWAVNQLYWRAREQFEEVLSSAAPLRSGSLAHGAEHREALAVLRRRASEILEASGHAPSEATLRRIMTTVSAIAATGGFDPDAAGALSTDRDPPGFEAFGIGDGAAAQVERSASAATTAPASPPRIDKRPTSTKSDSEAGDRGRHRREQAVTRERERKERERAEQEREAREKERKRREAERRKVEAELVAAQRDLEAKELQVDEQRQALTRAEQACDRARNRVAELEERVTHLANAPLDSIK